jgi:hypothetical protein
MPTWNSRIEYIGGHLADPLGVMTRFLTVVRTMVADGWCCQHPNGTKMG